MPCLALVTFIFLINNLLILIVDLNKVIVFLILLQYDLLGVFGCCINIGFSLNPLFPNPFLVLLKCLLILMDLLLITGIPIGLVYLEGALFGP